MAADYPDPEDHAGHESGDESDGDDELDAIPELDLDVSKLTPLSPEVISKQVRSLPKHHSRA
jgi:hypothetical protein